MHRGRIYPIDNNLRVQTAPWVYPSWWAAYGYTGFASFIGSADWPGAVPTSLGPWLLTNYTDGDRDILYSLMPQTYDGSVIEVEYWARMNGNSTRMELSVELYVDSVLQAPSVSTDVPERFPTPGGYAANFQAVPPAGTRQLRFTAVLAVPVQY